MLYITVKLILTCEFPSQLANLLINQLVSKQAYSKQPITRSVNCFCRPREREVTIHSRQTTL